MQTTYYNYVNNLNDIFWYYNIIYWLILNDIIYDNINIM